jgi:hypothetical protein
MGHVSPWLPTEHVKIAAPTKQFFSSVTDRHQTNRFFKETDLKIIYDYTSQANVFLNWQQAK